MRVCIYCLERKHEERFNREHVIPEAFGAFKGNLVLDCVCWDCNDYFGKSIDLKFARDSIEGMGRYWSGEKSSADFRSLGPRSTTSVKFKDGDIHGGTGFTVANPKGRELKVFAFPQIGFEQPPNPIRWFRLNELPEKHQLGELGFDRAQGCNVHVREMSIEEAVQALAAKGFEKLEQWQTSMPDPDELIETEIVGIIGRPEKRMATKIAMNYLASIAGPALLRTAAFDDARNFARHDVGESRVHVSENPWTLGISPGEPLRGHYLAAHTGQAGRIIAQVCLYLRIRYVVHLMSSNLTTGPWVIGSSHCFNIDSREVSRLRRVPPLMPGRQLQVAKSTP